MQESVYVLFDNGRGGNRIVLGQMRQLLEGEVLAVLHAEDVQVRETCK